MVFLGDLGRDLRYAEQAYWRSFNVVGGQMSETNFRRSVLGQWADPERIEFRFRHAFGELKEAWMSRFRWPLYLELHDDDRHNLEGLHVPTSEGFAEFDDELQSLAKVVVDSLNQEGMVTATRTRAGPPAASTDWSSYSTRSATRAPRISCLSSETSREHVRGRQPTGRPLTSTEASPTVGSLWVMPCALPARGPPSRPSIALSDADSPADCDAPGSPRLNLRDLFEAYLESRGVRASLFGGLAVGPMVGGTR